MNCKDLLSAYFKTLWDGSSCREDPNGRLSVVLPFLYPDHDNIEIFVRDKGDTVVISDLGETLRRLDTLGLDIESSGTLAFQVERITSGFQVGVENGAMFKEGPRDDAGTLMFDVLSACMAVGDLAYAGRNYRPLTFHEEVSKLLLATGLEFTENQPVTGAVTATHYSIDFMVVAPHRVSYVQAMAARTESGRKKWVNQTYRMWMDVQTAEEKVVRKVSLLNDDTSRVREEDVRLLQTVSTVFRWSDTPRFIASLRNGSGLSEAPQLA